MCFCYIFSVQLPLTTMTYRSKVCTRCKIQIWFQLRVFKGNKTASWKLLLHARLVLVYVNVIIWIDRKLFIARYFVVIIILISAWLALQLMKHMRRNSVLWALNRFQRVISNKTYVQNVKRSPLLVYEIWISIQLMHWFVFTLFFRKKKLQTKTRWSLIKFLVQVSLHDQLHNVVRNQYQKKLHRKFDPRK